MSLHMLLKDMEEFQESLVDRAEILETIKPTSPIQSIINTCCTIFNMSPLGYIFNYPAYRDDWRIYSIINAYDEPSSQLETELHSNPQETRQDTKIQTERSQEFHGKVGAI